MKTRPDFGIEKELEKPGNPREKAYWVLEMASGLSGDSIMKELDTKVRGFLEQYHVTSKAYIEGKYSPQALEELFGAYTNSLIELFRTTKWNWMTHNDSTLYALYERGQKVESLGAAIEQFTQLSTDEAMLNLEMNKTPEQIENKRNQIDVKVNDLRNIVFSRIVSAYQLKDEGCGQLENLFDSELVDVYTKRLVVAAVMLNAIEFYEDRKVSLLYKLYQNHPDLVVRQRALVAVIMVGIKHPFSPQLGTIISEMAKDKATCLAIFDIQKVVQMSKTVDTDGHKAVGTILRGVFSSAAKELTNQLNEDGVFDEEIELPEDVEQDCKSDFEVMLDSQTEGVDIYFTQFKHMKKVDFFHSLYNWFMPYYYENSALSAVRERLKTKEDLFKILPYVSNLCDSDVYTMALSAAMDPKGQNFMGLDKLSLYGEEDEDDEEYEDDEDWDDDEQDELAHDEKGYTMNEALQKKYQEISDPNRKLSKAEREKEEMECRHKFIHDLYRVYVLSPMKDSFFNPFDANKNTPFVCQDYYKDSIFEKMRIALGRFGALRRDFEFVYKVLPKVEEPASELNQMRAAACCCIGKYDEAMSIISDFYHGGGSQEVYLQLHLDCYVQMDSPKQIDILHQLEEIEKDTEKRFMYKLRELDFYLSHNMEKEALSLAYTLDNEYPKREAVECRLAEALMYATPYQKQNLHRAKDLLTPYMNGLKQQLQRMGLMDKPDGTEDSEEMKKKMTALFSIMLQQLTGKIDRVWQSRKGRAYGICTWILDGQLEAETQLIESCQFKTENRIDVFKFKDKELDLLLSFGISQEEVYMMSERIMEPLLQMKNHGRKQ